MEKEERSSIQHSRFPIAWFCVFLPNATGPAEVLEIEFDKVPACPCFCNAGSPNRTIKKTGRTKAPASKRCALSRHDSRTSKKKKRRLLRGSEKRKREKPSSRLRICLFVCRPLFRFQTRSSIDFSSPDSVGLFFLPLEHLLPSIAFSVLLGLLYRQQELEACKL